MSADPWGFVSLSELLESHIAAERMPLQAIAFGAVEDATRRLGVAFQRCTDEPTPATRKELREAVCMVRELLPSMLELTVERFGPYPMRRLP